MLWWSIMYFLITSIVVQILPYRKTVSALLQTCPCISNLPFVVQVNFQSFKITALGPVCALHLASHNFQSQTFEPYLRMCLRLWRNVPLLFLLSGNVFLLSRSP